MSTSKSQASSSVRVIVTKDVPAENQQEWLKLAHQLSMETWKEDGCISYNFVRNHQKKNRFVIVEEWESQSHLEAHFQTPHFQKLVPLMDSMSHTADLDVCSDALTISREECSLATTSASSFALGDNRRKRNGRILVLFDTATGSTQDMATLIAEGAQLLDRIDVRIRVVPGEYTSWEDPSIPRDKVYPFASFSDLYWADGVAVGSPTNLGCMSYRMKKFWDDFSQSGGWGRVDGKIGTAFTSQGGHGGGGELVNMAIKTVLMNCGYAVFGITDYVGFKDTMHYGAAVAKKPRDEVDKMKCRRQGLRLAEFVAYYINGRDEAHPMHTKTFDFDHWGFPGIPPRSADMDALKERNSMPHVSLLKTQNNTAAIAARRKKQALIFTKMIDYVHDSTPAMAAWVLTKVHEMGWDGIVSEDSDLINSKSKIAEFDMIIFLNNSGDIFQETDGLLSHIQAGKGVLGVHAAIASFLNDKDESGATIMEPTSDIFERIFGSHFQNHPPVQTGTVIIDHLNAGKLAPLLSTLPAKFTHHDEFFNFTLNVAHDQHNGKGDDGKGEIKVIAWADASSYEGSLMGEKHPIVWYREMGENMAPVFYCALGHFSHFYNGMGPSHVATLLETGLRFCSRSC
mmetsp:Transcript_17382/g.32970  ORF Transcript_17382/g.32970 Transcript_17382/m.32970 type:complete len:626 (-) Transcript_17382:126-2003(-)|eukprot:CAMPEP_0176497400 /NCGR_PEP_ID=MMETSP0200_2-20121128/11703_1 /TAXON_ID=947934 /ORGANISM="Chaetoceros sp., Strain GSL56" /LENGTH=625 /DNA_ID=CAMNT_0017895409 /DNA_START=78 /DNA_END=1955 /DNA_ORIENTATION=+